LSITLKGGFDGGWDSGKELRTYQLFKINGGWLPGLYHGNMSSSLLVAWLIPYVAELTGAPWDFFSKLIIPVAYSLVPVLCYHLYVRYGGRVAASVCALAVLYFMTHPVMFDMRVMMGLFVYVLMLLAMQRGIGYVIAAYLLLGVTYYNMAVLATPVFGAYILFQCVKRRDARILAAGILPMALIMAWMHYSTLGFFFKDLWGYLGGSWHWRIDGLEHILKYPFTFKQAFLYSFKCLPMVIASIGLMLAVKKWRHYTLPLALTVGFVPLIVLWQIPLWTNYEPYKAFILGIVGMMVFVPIGVAEAKVRLNMAFAPKMTHCKPNLGMVKEL